MIHQPVGRQLFRMYCDTKPDLKKAIGFLDEIVSYFFLIRCNCQFLLQSVFSPRERMGWPILSPQKKQTDRSSQECIIYFFNHLPKQMLSGVFFCRFYSRYSVIFPMPKNIFFHPIFKGKSDVNDSRLESLTW